MTKVILHLCADTGSDSKPWADAGYTVIKVGKDIGVENFSYQGEVYGVFANPVCTEFSTARKGGQPRNPDEGMFLVKECLRIIDEVKPKFWVIENPARGVLKNYLGEPTFKYQPYQYGSPWSKHTALWGKFNIPPVLYKTWKDVPESIKIKELYVRPGRKIPSLAFMHQSHRKYIQEFNHFNKVDSDMEFRSLCSQMFAQAFYEANKPNETP